MAEKIRVFVGATELNYSNLTVERTDDYIVDQVKLKIEGNTNVLNSSLIDVRKNDGLTSIFVAQVNDIQKGTLWDINAYGRGYELNNIHTIQVFENKSPEFIVEDLITTLSPNLTYASTAGSGFTITKYIANGYLIDIINEMREILDWQIRIDSSDNFFFEQKANINNGLILTNGDNFQVTSWDEDKNKLVNHVRIIGGDANYNKQDSFTASASQTTFTLTKKASGTVVVQKDGVVQTPGADGDGVYHYNGEEGKVIFNTGLSGGEAILVDYSFQVDVVVEDQDDPSIALHGETFKEVNFPSVDTFHDARQLAQKFLNQFSSPFQKVKGFRSGLDFDRDVNEEVVVIDNIRTPNRNETLVIRKLEINAEENRTIFHIGVRDNWVFDWQKEVQDRVKKLENRFQTDSAIAVSRIFKHDMSIAQKQNFQPEFNRPRDSFIFSNNTLSRMRTTRNHEPDCSNASTVHTGHWKGTSIDGAQYTFTDIFTDLVGFWRMNERTGTNVNDSRRQNDGTTSGSPIFADGKHGSCIQFDGTDDLVDLTDQTDFEFGASDFTIEAWIRLDTLPSSDEDYTIFSKWIETGNQREYKFFVDFANDKLSLSTSSNGTLETTVVANTALAINAFRHVMVVKQGTTATFYLDGVADGSGTVDATLNTGTAKAHIGATEGEATDPDSLFDGRIDNVRIYSNDLTAEQALELFDLSGRTNFANSHGSFNGTDNYIAVADATDLKFTGDFTIALAVKVDSLPSALDTIIEKRSATDGYEVRIAADNQVELIYSSSSSDTTLKTGTTLVAGKFQHIVFTKNGTAIASFVNGVAGNTTTGGATVGTTTNELRIGRDSASNFFTGHIDEVKIFDNDKTAAEVLNLSKKFDVVSDLVAYWAMDDARFGDRFTKKKELTVS